MKNELPFGQSNEPEPASLEPEPRVPIIATNALYAAEPTRSGMVACGVCERENHETRLWCTACGHQLGVPIEVCVCEGCLKG